MTLVSAALGCLLLAACSSTSGGDGTQTNGFGGLGGAFGNGGFGGSVVGNGGQGGAFVGNGGLGGAFVGNGGLGGAFLGNGGQGGAFVGNGGEGGAFVGNGGQGGAGQTTNGCGTTTLLPLPSDPSVRGPWVVGVKTVKVGRLTAEVVYPAQPGSEAGLPPVTYDIRDWLPKNAVQNIAGFTPVADSESPAVQPIGGNLFRDVPIDAGHGPYPAVILMHGTSSFRIASGSTMVQWASRGFVVIAADYPGLMLADQLCTAGCGCPTSGAADYAGDINTQITALTSPSGDLAFLAGHVDMSRIALSGHSVGGCTIAELASDTNVQVIIPLSTDATVASAGGSLKSILYYAGMKDTVFTYAPANGASGIGDIVCTPGPLGGYVSTAYTNSVGPPNVKKRLVGVTGGGHLAPTDLCQVNADGNNAITVLHNHHWCGVDAVAVFGLPRLFDCGDPGFDWKAGVNDLNYASTAVLEETLLCQDRTAQFAALKTNLPTVGDFQEAK